MAVRVDNHVRRGGAELQSVGFVAQELFNKLFEEKAAARDFVNALKVQLTVIFNEHRIAGRLQKEDRGIFRVAVEQGQIVGSQLCSFLEMPLAEGGAATAFAAGGQGDVVTGGLKDFHGGDANVRVVIADEGVVPENDSAAGATSIHRSLVPVEPRIETLPGIVRQGTLPGDADGF